jgi:putative spermidine/putrescine transport system permease protein
MRAGIRHWRGSDSEGATQNRGQRGFGAEAKAALLLAPSGIFIAVLLICALTVIRLSFGEKGAEWTAWSLANYTALDERLYVKALWTTTRLSFLSAVIVVLLAFPIALCLARTRSLFIRRFLLICVLLPMLVSLLVQSYGWIVMLGPDGSINVFLKRVGVIEKSIPFLFSETGVLMAMVQTTIPLAILPIASALRNVSFAYEEAGSLLGASRLRVYQYIIIPLAMPGILAGSLLVFGFNMGAFVIPLLLGGLKVAMIAVLIRDQMGPLLNWPFGAALSVLLIGVALVVQIIYQSLVSQQIAQTKRP